MNLDEIAELMKLIQQSKAKLPEHPKQIVLDPSCDPFSHISPNEDILDYKRHQIETKSFPQSEYWLFESLPATTSLWGTFKNDLLDQQGVNVLRKFYSPENVKLLTLFGRWLNALHDGYDKPLDERMVIKPKNDIEEHFALVSHGRKNPKYYFEKVWLSFHANRDFLMLTKHEKYGDCSWAPVLAGFLRLADRGDQNAQHWLENNGGRDCVLAQIKLNQSQNEGLLGIYYYNKEVRG